MKTDVITLYSDLKGRDNAIDTAEKFSAYLGLTGRNAMHLRLLTEETICMLHGILSDFKGSFWLESSNTKNGLLCRICVSAEKSVNERQEDDLLAVATSGKNENAKGIAGKIRELIRWSVQQSETDNFTSNAWYYMGTAPGGIKTSVDAYLNCWSLQQYREAVSSSEKASEEERDELERSIIANIADEVKVWLKKDETEIVIEKLFRNDNT